MLCFSLRSAMLPLYTSAEAKIVAKGKRRMWTPSKTCHDTKRGGCWLVWDGKASLFLSRYPSSLPTFYFGLRTYQFLRCLPCIVRCVSALLVRVQFSASEIFPWQQDAALLNYSGRLKDIKKTFDKKCQHIGMARRLCCVRSYNVCRGNRRTGRRGYINKLSATIAG